MIELPDDLWGVPLDCVRELIFTPPDQSAPAMREAVELCLGSRSLIVKSLCDTSEIRVFIGTLTVESSDYLIRDASKDKLFCQFIGKPLRNWWAANNDRGYADSFLIAFEERSGLCFVAMNNVVSVLNVSGDQWS